MRKRRTLLLVLALSSALMAMSASPAAATRPSIGPGESSTSGIPGTYPAGVACSFPVSFEVVSGGEGRTITFFDQNGDVTRLSNLARASTWRFTNLDTGDSVTVDQPGGVTKIVPSADGSATVTLSGGIIGFNAPTDTPPGPFSLAVTGHLIFVIAPDGSGTITQLSGKVMNLCAAVS